MKISTDEIFCHEMSLTQLFLRSVGGVGNAMIGAERPLDLL